jgi:hypothetical protein
LYLNLCVRVEIISLVRDGAVFTKAQVDEMRGGDAATATTTGDRLLDGAETKAETKAAPPSPAAAADAVASSGGSGSSDDDDIVE